MKQKFFIFSWMSFFFFLYLIPSWALTPMELVADAETFFKEGKYQEAISKWEILKSLGLGGDVVDYNIGNAYFRKGQWGLAKVYWLRAQKKNPRDPNVYHNLNFLEKTLKGNNTLNQDQQLFLASGLKKMAIRFRLTDGEALYLNAILALFLGTLFISFYFWKKRILKGILLVLLPCYCISLLILGGKGMARLSKPLAIILESSWVKEEPIENSNNLAELKEGDEVRLIDIEGEVVFIKTRGGVEGWVSQTALMEI